MFRTLVGRLGLVYSSPTDFTSGVASTRSGAQGQHCASKSFDRVEESSPIQLEILKTTWALVANNCAVDLDPSPTFKGRETPGSAPTIGET